MFHLYFNHLVFQATSETIYMVFISSFLGILGGLTIGLILYLIRKKKSILFRLIYIFLNININIIRSIPYIIFMISILPFTRFLVGTSIGINAAIVSLTFSAIPFYARITENAIDTVSKNLIKATESMGANNWQLIKVYFYESYPLLIKGAVLTIISVLSYSAMAGVIGGGGIGELAIQYGYQQFNITIIIYSVIILTIMALFIQTTGNWLSRIKKFYPVIIFSLILWIYCIFFILHNSKEYQGVIKVGIVNGPMQTVMKLAKKIAKRNGLILDIKTFDDYILPNIALNNGDIDANIYQHKPFLENQIQKRHYEIVSIGKTFIYPMGLYSIKLHSLNELKKGDVISIPSDPANRGRALIMIAKSGLIKLKSNVGLFPNIQDIIRNPKRLIFICISAAQIPRSLKDVSSGVITNDYVKISGLNINKSLLHENKNTPYVNLIVVRKKDQNNIKLKKLVDIMHSDPIVQKTMEIFKNEGAIIGWK